MHIDGQCHCGKITYEAEIDPEQVSVCHCTDCQALTGSPFRVTAICAKADVKLTAGTPKVYGKRGDNGR
ncbi:MAG: GFA family protein, partial [Bradyrhizobium sp.]